MEGFYTLPGTFVSLPISKCEKVCILGCIKQVIVNTNINFMLMLFMVYGCSQKVNTPLVSLILLRNTSGCNLRQTEVYKGYITTLKSFC